MIFKNLIIFDLPDLNTEFELYTKAKAYQIHTYSIKCGGPATSGYTCKKGFPRPFSSTTYYDNNTHKFIYKCTKPEDQWIVPYHPETLMIWDAHMNI